MDERAAKAERARKQLYKHREARRKRESQMLGIEHADQKASQPDAKGQAHASQAETQQPVETAASDQAKPDTLPKDSPPANECFVLSDSAHTQASSVEHGTMHNEPVAHFASELWSACEQPEHVRAFDFEPQGAHAPDSAYPAAEPVTDLFAPAPESEPPTTLASLDTSPYMLQSLREPERNLYAPSPQRAKTLDNYAESFEASIDAPEAQQTSHAAASLFGEHEADASGTPATVFEYGAQNDSFQQNDYANDVYDYGTYNEYGNEAYAQDYYAQNEYNYDNDQAYGEEFAYEGHDSDYNSAQTFENECGFDTSVHEFDPDHMLEPIPEHSEETHAAQESERGQAPVTDDDPKQEAAKQNQSDASPFISHGTSEETGPFGLPEQSEAQQDQKAVSLDSHDESQKPGFLDFGGEGKEAGSSTQIKLAQKRESFAYQPDPNHAHEAEPFDFEADGVQRDDNGPFDFSTNVEQDAYSYEWEFMGSQQEAPPIETKPENSQQAEPFDFTAESHQNEPFEFDFKNHQSESLEFQPENDQHAPFELQSEKEQVQPVGFHSQAEKQAFEPEQRDAASTEFEAESHSQEAHPFELQTKQYAQSFESQHEDQKDADAFEFKPEEVEQGAEPFDFQTQGEPYDHPPEAFQSHYEFQAPFDYPASEDLQLEPVEDPNKSKHDALRTSQPESEPPVQLTPAAGRLFMDDGQDGLVDVQKLSLGTPQEPPADAYDAGHLFVGAESEKTDFVPVFGSAAPDSGDDARSQLASLQRAHDTLQADHQALQADHDALLKAHASLETEHEQLKHRALLVDQLERRVVELQAALENHEQGMAAARAKEAEYLKTIAAFEEERQQFETHRPVPQVSHKDERNTQARVRVHRRSATTSAAAPRLPPLSEQEPSSVVLSRRQPSEKPRMRPDPDMPAAQEHRRRTSLSMLRARMASDKSVDPDLLAPTLPTRKLSIVQTENDKHAASAVQNSVSMARSQSNQFSQDDALMFCGSCKGDLIIV